MPLVSDWIGGWVEDFIARYLGEDFIGPPTREQQGNIDLLRDALKREHGEG